MILLINFYQVTYNQVATAIANQLPDHLASTQTDYTGLNYFKFITALIVSSIEIV